MVKRFTGIPAKKDADSWINEGGLDHELQVSAEPVEIVEKKTKQNNDKDYPHRISLDVSKDMYKKLKKKAVDEDKKLGELLRDIISQHLD